MEHRRLTRRGLLLDAGKVTLGAVVLGLSACAAADEGEAPPTSPAPDGTTPDTTGASPATAAPTPSGSEAAAAWQRVDLGFVSAYVIVRGGQATLVDSGVGGSAGAIEGVLTAAGSRWEDLGDVILTHRHPDHAGSVGEIAELAPDATFSIGTGDLDAIDGIVAATGVDDGATVAGLTIVGTPGHTPGHVAVLDPTLGVLLAGDAINGTDVGGEVTGPNERFTEDMSAAIASVRALAGLDFDTVLFGHGEPLRGGASAAIGDLADTLEA